MKKLRDSIHVEDAIFKRLDAGEKNLIQILALTVPSSAIVAGIVIWFSIKLLIGSGLIAFLASVFVAILLFLHDSSLLADKGVSRSYFRLGLSMAFAVVLAIPLKVSLVDSDLTDRIKEEIRIHNLNIEKELMAEKQKIYDEENKLMDRITEAGKTFSNTKSSQELLEARRAKDAFLKQKKELIASLDKTYGGLIKSEEVTRLDLAAYYFTHMFSTKNPKDIFLNLSIFLLLLLLESLPALIRLQLEGGEYLQKVDHAFNMKQKTDLEVQNLENGILSIDNLQELPNKVEEIRLWKELDKASKNGFQSTDRLYELANVYARKSKQADSQSTSSPLPPKPSKNGKASVTDEFADFQYE